VMIGFAWPMASGRHQYFVSTNILRSQRAGLTARRVAHHNAPTGPD
jgi:hypothetical protein